MTQAANLGALGTNVNSSGNLASPTFTGQATIPTIKLTGGQITFPATQVPSADANTLDDYEEGTWTPALSFSGGNGTAVINATYINRYTKIGRLVTIEGYFDFNKGTASGSFSITGLPFSNSGSPNRSPGSVNLDGGGKASNVVVAEVFNATVSVTFASQSTSYASTAVLASDLNANPYIRFVITYSV